MRPSPSTAARRARNVLGPLVVVSLIGTFVAVPAIPASASDCGPSGDTGCVSTISLPSGNWDVKTSVVSKSETAADTLSYGTTSGGTEVCADCAGGESLTSHLQSGDVTFYLTDQSCGETFASTNTDHARIDQTDATDWTIYWDDSGGCSPDGNFIDLITSVVATGADTEMSSKTVTSTSEPSGVIYANDTASENTVDYTITITNNGPLDAQDVKVTDDLLNTPTFGSVSAFGSADFCHGTDTTDCLNNGFSSFTGSYTFDTAVPTGESRVLIVKAHANKDLRGGALLGVTNTAEVSSSTGDPNLDNNSATSGSVEIDTVPDQVPNKTTPPPDAYDVQPGNTNAVVSWSSPTREGGSDGGEQIDFYEINVSAASNSVTGLGKYDIYPPGATLPPTPPPGVVLVANATSCVGRLGGNLCYNLTGLTNDTGPVGSPNVIYGVSIQAHNAVGLSDGQTLTASPSASNAAQIVPQSTAQTFMTCSTATTNTPICIVYTVPLGGGGGAFSTQAITDAFNQCVALGGTEADCSTYANRGSFEGHPPAGYTTSNPLMIQITWDVSVAPLGLATPVYYQRDGLAPKLLSTCDKNKKGGIKYPIHPDPCLKAIKILGKTKDTSKQCKPQSACFGDVQAQILLSSNPTDGGIYHK